MPQYTSEQAESGFRFANCDAAYSSGQRGRYCPCSTRNDCYTGTAALGADLSGSCVDDDPRPIYPGDAGGDAGELARAQSYGYIGRGQGDSWDFDDGGGQCR